MLLTSVMMTEAIGWLSSTVLVVTIGNQVYKQWHDRTSKGVSKWLFLGQMLASSGFVAYSWLVHDWVFVVTNALMLVSAVIGFAIVLRHRRAEAAAARRAPPPRHRTASGARVRDAVDEPEERVESKRFAHGFAVEAAGVRRTG